MQKGFSLLELIITLAIAAIVIGIAAPGFSSMIQDNRLSSQSLDFVSALNLARSEAIKRRARVVLCKSADGQDCADAGNWEQGWIVFVDDNGNNQRDDDDDETILRVHGPLGGGNTLVGNNSVSNALAYLPDGRSTAWGTLSLCDAREDNDKSKAIRINQTGRVMVSSVAEALNDNVNAEECA